jgi:hypothetical protein
VKVVERFLLDRIDAKAGRLAVTGQLNLVSDPLPHEAKRTLPLVQATVARAQIALDPAVIETVVPAPDDVVRR